MKPTSIKFLMGCIISATFLIACSKPENEAREMLNHALLLKQEKKFVEAEELLKKVATQYPKTKVATKALEELEQMKTDDGAESTLFSELISYHKEYYEDREKCLQCESDANDIAAAIADYFCDPKHTELPIKDDLKLSISNPYSISGDPYKDIIIQVKDASGRCPREYQEQYQELFDSKSSCWKDGVFTKTLSTD